MGFLKDLFFGNDTESEESNMSEELKNEGALITTDMLVGDGVSC